MNYEYFHDPCYYDMWAVRRKDQRAFSQAWHVATQKEAQSLAEHLNKLELAPIPQQ